MKKTRLYIDTSVFGGYFDIEDPERVNTAENLIKLIKDGLYEGFISFLTLEEILKAPYEIQGNLKNTIAETGLKILEETEECIELSDAYINDGIIPVKYRNDARHIAIGVYHEVDFIVSWNYRHMVNITVRRLINSTNLKMGYSPIEIISPEEVVGYGEVEI
ncbi:MAG: PIN domain-containing protein [Nitrospirota bacterium]